MGEKGVILCFFIFVMVMGNIYSEVRKDVEQKIKKVENSKDPLEIFKTALWLYRRGIYSDFGRLFQKALQVDREVNKDKMKLADILGYVKYEVEETNEIEEDEEEFEQGELPSGKKHISKAAPAAKVNKKYVYDSVIKKIKYLKKKMKADETIFEDTIVKKEVAQKKIKEEKDKVGWEFTDKLTSAHFILYSDIGLDGAIGLLDNLEAFFNTFYFFFEEAIDFKKYKNKKIVINVFSKKQTYSNIVNKRYNVRTDNRPFDLYFHLRRNDNSLFDIKNDVVLATIETAESMEVKGGKKEVSMIDFVMSLPEIYKSVLESFLYTYIFKGDKKYAELGQCFWTGFRTYFSYLIPGEIAFTIGSYVGGEPFLDIDFTKEAISNKEIPDLKLLLTNNNFEDPMRQFKKYELATFLRIYTTECYAIFYYLFHKTNPADLDKILRGLANRDNFSYSFFSTYIKSDEELYKFIEEDLKKEVEKYKVGK